jgi:hypothetical protein
LTKHQLKISHGSEKRCLQKSGSVEMSYNRRIGERTSFHASEEKGARPLFLLLFSRQHSGWFFGEDRLTVVMPESCATDGKIVLPRWLLSSAAIILTPIYQLPPQMLGQ